MLCLFHSVEYRDDSIYHMITLRVFNIWKVFVFESPIHFPVGRGMTLTSPPKIVPILLFLTLTSFKGERLL